MTKSKIRDWIPGPRFRHFPKIFPRIFPKIFPNSSCKNIIKSYLFGAVHTGVLIKNGLGKILGKIFGKCLNWGPDYSPCVLSLHCHSLHFLPCILNFYRSLSRSPSSTPGARKGNEIAFPILKVMSADEMMERLPPPPTPPPPP